MRLIDADALKEEISDGKIIIDEDVLECENVAEILVYLLEKVEACVMEKIDAQPTVETKYQEIVERLGSLPIKKTIKYVESKKVPEFFYEVVTGEYISKKETIEIVKEVGGMNV